jgi:Axonemal dynein light chain
MSHDSCVMVWETCWQRHLACNTHFFALRQRMRQMKCGVGTGSSFRMCNHAPRARALRLQQLESDKADLERSVAELRHKSEAMEAREAERRTLEAKAHADEVAYLKRYTEQLKNQLETAAAASAAAVPGGAASPEGRAAG